MPLPSLILAATLALGPGGSVSELGAFVSAAAKAQDPSKAAPYEPKASELLALVQAFYDGSQDLTARFKQTYYNPSFGTKTVSNGTLKLQKPGRMVWDYDNKVDPDFYADGKTLWVVEHDTRQVVTKRIDASGDLDAAMKFLFGGEQLVREFKARYADARRVKLYGRDNHRVVELKPKASNPNYKGLLLVVHSTTGRVSAFVVYNHDGSTNAFELSDLKTNVGLEAASFTFKVPKGYVETKEEELAGG